MVSTKAVRQAIYQALNTASVTTLLANGSASLFHAVASPSANYPLLIFNMQAGTSTKRFGGDAFDDYTWLVKGVVRGTSSSVAEDIAKAVSDRLNFGSLTITGGSLMYLARKEPVDYVEIEGDQQYRHHGAHYRVTVQDA